MADKDGSGPIFKGRFWHIATVAGISVVVFILIVLWKLPDKEKVSGKTSTRSVATSTAELPSLVAMVRSGRIEDCSSARDVILQEDIPGRATIPLRPCRSGYYTIPETWTKFDSFTSVPDEELIFWDLSGRRYELSPGVATKPTRVGRTFRVAGPGGVLYIYRNHAPETRTAEGNAPENVQVTEGTVIRHSPQAELLIVSTAEGEKKFHVTRNTPIQVGFKTKYLGKQSIFSSKEGSLLEKGDVVKLRTLPNSAEVIEAELVGDVSPSNGAQLVSEVIQGSSGEEIQAGAIPEMPADTLYGIVEVASEESGIIILETKEGTRQISAKDGTPIFIHGERCHIGTLRPGDPVAVIFLPGTKLVKQIEVDPLLPGEIRSARAGNLWNSYFPKFKKEAPAQDTWNRYFF